MKVMLKNSLSIVIVSYNTCEHVRSCLDSILRQANPLTREIIVVDNGSTDGSITWLSNHYPDIKVIRNKNNYGFAKGYNEVLKFINAPYLVLLNSDVEVTSHWIEPII